ncbi:hypothetical protein B296_00039938, partial [Ensete ventricosum]
SPCQEAAAPATGSAPGHGRKLPLLAAALAGDTSTRKRRLCELLPLWVTAGICRPLRAGLSRSWLPLAANLVVGGRPYMGASRGWSPLLLLIAFATKM